MTTELTVLAWGCILGLVHIIVAAQARTHQFGLKWNMSSRDKTPGEPSPFVGRLLRAQANYFETFPIMAAAILIVSVAGVTTRWTAIGTVVWLAARVAYLPIYGLGIQLVRSLLFVISMIGLWMTIWPALFG